MADELLLTNTKIDLAMFTVVEDDTEIHSWLSGDKRLIAIAQKQLDEARPIIEKTAMRQRQSWLINVCGWRKPEQVEAMIEEAKKQERERIGQTILSMIDNAPLNHKLGQIENWTRFYLLDGKP